MIAVIEHEKNQYKVDLNAPIDLSIPLGDVKCFSAPDVKIEPYTNGEFVGAVKQGAPVNFFNVALNPHGNGTHTECMGHITKEQESVNKSLKTFHFIATLISTQVKTDAASNQIITLDEIKKQCVGKLTEALIIRTLPNDDSKLTMDYSEKNPPYLSDKAMQYIVRNNVKHLLIDLPSVDKEVDDGLLIGHHTFWGLDKNSIKKQDRTKCTITELIYVDTSIKDGIYFLNLQIAPLELDASPSKPVIYRLKKME